MSVEKPQVSKASKWAANLVLILMVGGIGAGIFFGVTMTSDLKDAGDAYIEALQQKDYAAAYAMLAPQTKAGVTIEQFKETMFTPLIANSTSHVWNHASAGTTDEGCLLGGMISGGEPESVWLYMWRATLQR